MKKRLFILFAVLQASFVFAQNRYISSDGIFIYNFNEDFTKYECSAYDDPEYFFSEREVLHEVDSRIVYWTIEDIKYIFLNADDYFILRNNDKQFTFVKDFEQYWQETKEKLGFYEATSEKKIQRTRYDAYNLLYLNFEPWISDSEYGGIEDSITIETEKNIKKFRILNGYVSFDYPEYFEHFNRVKLIFVYDEENNFIDYFEIEDSSEIQTFEFEEELSYVRFEIEDVYDGTVYDDTAISLIQCF